MRPRRHQRIQAPRGHVTSSSQVGLLCHRLRGGFCGRKWRSTRAICPHSSLGGGARGWRKEARPSLRRGLQHVYQKPHDANSFDIRSLGVAFEVVLGAAGSSCAGTLWPLGGLEREFQPRATDTPKRVAAKGEKPR